MSPASLLSRIGHRIARQRQAWRKTPVQYRIGQVTIELPPDHLLPIYQQAHKLYDRFLPELVTHIEHGAVVDVGANCGDTLAAMFDHNPRLDYVCIEADREFFRYLSANAAKLKALDSAASITLVNCLAGDVVKNATLRGANGTKNAVINSGDAAAVDSIPIDAIEEVQSQQTVALIKVDTDGYDYDVLNSAAMTIARDEPMLFFECYMTEAHQQDGYRRLTARLSEQGYKYWVVFDNFGEAMLSTSDPDVVASLVDYIWSQHTGRASRTVAYFDFLACNKASHVAIARLAVSDYLSKPFK